MAHGKIIELFLTKGTSDKLTIAELSNWNGKAIKIPRIEVADCALEDLEQAGVYFLFCKEDSESDSVYIGESENIKDRLMQHINDYQYEKEKYYWHTAVIFIGRDLNKALIRYLENRFFEIAKECHRYSILTKQTYKNTVIKDSQKAAMEEFIDNVKILINTLGYKVLEPLTHKDSDNTSPNEALLYINKGNVIATGRVTFEGFVVLKGSTINEKLSIKSVSARIVKLRDKYLSDGTVENLTFTEDTLFSSSSAAADFILGYSASGPRTWTDKSGVTLKEIEARYKI